jgi:ATP/maltotriose-dependent transcriptional regulator MalT
MTLDGHLDDAVAAYEQSMVLTAELSSHEDEGFLLGRLADLEMRRGNLEQARTHVLRARDSADEQGAPIEAMFTLTMLAALEHEVGNVKEAKALQDEAMRRMSAMPEEHPGHSHIRAFLLAGCARIAFDDHDLGAARDFAGRSFEAAVGTQDLPVIAAIGVTLADIVASAGELERAAEMLGASARLRGADDPTARDITKLTRRLTEALGADRFARLYDDGKALDRDTAIERLRPSELG